MFQFLMYSLERGEKWGARIHKVSIFRLVPTPFLDGQLTIFKHYSLEITSDMYRV